MRDEIILLNEDEALFCLKKLSEKNPLNYGDTISYLGQVTLKRYFRHIGQEKFEISRNTKIMEKIKNHNKEILRSLYKMKKIKYEETDFKFTGKKYKFKGKQIFIKIL